MNIFTISMPIALCYVIGPSSTRVRSHINVFLSYLYRHIYAQEVQDHYFFNTSIFDLYNLEMAVSNNWNYTKWKVI